MSYLHVSDLSVFQKQRCIVKDVSFDIKRGELVALLGLNGSGKTTLMKGICGLLKSRGEFVIGESSSLHTASSSLQKLISYIPQRSNLQFHIRVLDIVLMGFAPQMSLFENYRKSHENKAIEALAVVEMDAQYNADFLTLSEGQKQLVILARALVQNTDLMLFDEPDSAMDFNNKHLVLKKIQEIVHESKCGILSLHDANFALQYCDRALILKDGHLVHDLDLRTATQTETQDALRKIYGEIQIENIQGNPVMFRR